MHFIPIQIVISTKIPFQTTILQPHFIPKVLVKVLINFKKVNITQGFDFYTLFNMELFQSLFRRNLFTVRKEIGSKTYSTIIALKTEIRLEIYLEVKIIFD